MIPQTPLTSPPWTWLFDVSPTVRDAGGGIFVLRARARVCVCVFVGGGGYAHFKVVVCFCSKLTGAPEVIKMWWRLLEMIGAVHLCIALNQSKLFI